MFLKKQTISKNGKTYEYFRIVSTYRDELGRRKHRTEKYLGALSSEEVSRVKAELRNRTTLSVQGQLSVGSVVTSVTFVFQEINAFAYAPQSPREWNVTSTDMLLLVREGRGEIQMGGSKFFLKAGTAFYCPAGSGMHVNNPYEETLQLDRITFITIAPIDAAGRLESEGVYGRVADAHWMGGEIPLLAPERALQLGAELHEAASLNSQHNSLRSQLIFYQLLSLVFNKQSVQADEENGGRWIDNVVQYIRDHYQEKLTRDRLAAMIGISPEYFSRVFKQETGQSFLDYLCRMRIRKSQELLQLSPLRSIGEIAKLSGFQSEYYFSRKFKQITGLAPSSYRAKPKVYAALSSYAASCMLTLGVVPALGLIEPWMKEAHAKRIDLTVLEVVGDMSKESLRKLAQASPDLILAREQTAHSERLREISSVCEIPDLDDNWREPFFLLAEAVGKLREAEAWITRFEQKLVEGKRQLTSFIGRDETVAIIKIVSDKLYVYGRSTSMGGILLYEELGLKPPASVSRELIDRNIPNKAFSAEELPTFSADHLILFDYGSQWLPNQRTWMNTDAWHKLEAVRKGRIYTPNREVFYGYDTLSLEYQLEEIVRLLSAHSD
ncbi:ABC-type Fe3+-hydroxamate transport system, substrate-binding protein [Paenibacillus algorifonticola]|uniref:ABC-type Fe3+-hydroxamate transport system, substrate-binding protein n=1 Tax=Paenibacillus algorifonticola TaxID=684063 RepID=A0A1I2G5W5_9BACL|nr:AraC family transcriptional regulator [Paenibacillus algorifonticola]SFF12377.1 ABC-type Fe3+-hydroxamate transport system, substrate-binding protein [Paenibacillus algorifonticola]